MLSALLTGSMSFAITFLAIPAILRVAEEKKLFDIPDARKLHTRQIASLGGIGIFIGFLVSSLLNVTAKENAEFHYFFASSIVIFFLGLKDDILILSAKKKFIGQVGAAAILVHLANIRIDSMHGIFGLHELPFFLSLALSYSTIIVIINAFNLIDGVDGLAGSLGLMAMIIFGSYFYMNGLHGYALLAFAMGGSLLAFLFFNYHPAKIFMGDSGSLLLGMVNAVLVIKFINVASSATVSSIESSVAIGFSILLIPLIDTLRVFSIRIAKGRSPFAPDRNHIHHILLDKGMNHRSVTFACVAYNLLFVLFAWSARSLGPTLLLISMTLISFSLIGALLLFNKKVSVKRLHDTASQSQDQMKPVHGKLVALKNESIVVEAMAEQ